LWLADEAFVGLISDRELENIFIFIEKKGRKKEKQMGEKIFLFLYSWNLQLVGKLCAIPPDWQK
jgi:hypothetical protein